MRVPWIPLVMFVLGVSSSLFAQETPALMPLPQKVQRGAGKFLINNNFKIALRGREDMRVKRATERFQATLSQITGIPLPAPEDRVLPPKFIINWTTSGEKVQKLGEDESYRLEI